MTIRVASLFLTLMLFVVTGCGDGHGVRIPITGVVTVDGQPLKHGSVSFNPIKGQDKLKAGGGSLDEQGRFQISSFSVNDGLLAGEYEVLVLGLEPVAPTTQKWHAPKKYSSFKTSGLKATITSESETFDFKLSWEGEDPSEPYVEKF